MLIVTHACNLNCSYCYEKYKCSASMPFELAKSLVLKESALVRESSDCTEMEIQFMGGEPFMNFPLIRDVVDWLSTVDLGVPYHCFAMTNGTLMDGPVREWLESHRDKIVVGLSYDGTAAMQRANRGASADPAWHIRVWPKQGLHVTVSRKTLSTLADGVVSICRMGGRCRCALAQGEVWRDLDVQVYGRELKKLADFYLQHPDVMPDDGLLTRPLVHIGEKNLGKRACGSGGAMVTYDVDGTAYPCHMFTPLVLGKSALRLDEAHEYCTKTVDDAKCGDCPYQNWCPTCYGCNLAFRGDVSQRDHSLCGMIDCQLRAACDFQLEYFHRNQKRIEKADLPMLQAAIRTYNYLRGKEV